MYIRNEIFNVDQLTYMNRCIPKRTCNSTGMILYGPAQTLEIS